MYIIYVLSAQRGVYDIVDIAIFRKVMTAPVSRCRVQAATMSVCSCVQAAAILRGKTSWHLSLYTHPILQRSGCRRSLHNSYGNTGAGCSGNH
jgi:hypothetical protein